jgi:putative flippase GtrA
LNKFFRFCLVGAVGFVTDFGALYLATQVFGLNPLGGRLLSFLIAATVTWKLNRHFTFVQAGKGSGGEWLRYLLLTSVGGGVNILVYQVWLWLTDHSAVNLFIGVALGSAVALAFNFMLSKRLVFVKPNEGQ